MKCSRCGESLTAKRMCNCRRKVPKKKPSTAEQTLLRRQRFWEGCIENVRRINGSPAELHLANAYANMINQGKVGYALACGLFTPEECTQWKNLQDIQPTENWTEIAGVGVHPGGRFQVILGKDNFETDEALELPPYAMRFADVLRALHPALTSIEWSLLCSEPDCGRQAIHDDDPKLSGVDPRSEHAKSGSKGKKRVRTLSYSVIVALEDNNSPTCVLLLDSKKKEKTVTISQGGMIIFRGDCGHAGVDYKYDNTRAFLRLGTHEFPHNSEELAYY
jgi:hypothetical protein